MNVYNSVLLLRYRRTLRIEAARRFAPAMIRLDSLAGLLLRCCSSRFQSNSTNCRCLGYTVSGKTQKVIERRNAIAA